jgi:hypothetical protein
LPVTRTKGAGGASGAVLMAWSPREILAFAFAVGLI